MLKKNELSWQPNTTSLHQGAMADASLLSALLPPSPGSAGRWRLKDDASGLQSSAQMYRSAQMLSKLQVGLVKGNCPAQQ